LSKKSTINLSSAVDRGLSTHRPVLYDKAPGKADRSGKGERWKKGRMGFVEL